MALIDDADDQWSDAHDTFEDDNYQGLPQGIEEVEVHNGQVTVPDRGVKISTADKEDDSIVPESSRRPSLSIIGEHASDTASIHSSPAVHAAGTENNSTQHPSATRASELLPPSPIPTPSPPQSTVDNSQDRRNANRATIEVRSSNRLSGFFTNLIHRRDHLPNGSARNARDVRTSSPTPRPSSNTPSRSSSPLARSSTPPPPLPAPTLQELGLSLSALTPDLSPSHFSTPPTSGAFLAPRYLLLCHAQGLDVLPLESPPAPQPYALVRRVTFKSVVVMEQRGVLVAIAGRRDGVRVYALEEVKKAVEWRIEVEVRRERERMRRDALKRMTMGNLETITAGQESTGQTAKAASSLHDDFVSRPTHDITPIPPPLPPMPLIPRTPTIKKPKAPMIPLQIPEPSGSPPSYNSLSNLHSPLQRRTSVVSFSQTRSRSSSVTDVLGAAPSRRNTDATRPRDPDSKGDWVESSDDEAINIVAAGSSGSQALDERTSANLNPPNIPSQTSPRSSTSLTARENRPANLDLSLSRTNSAVVPPEPSPDPTLLSLRQALSHLPSRTRDAAATQQAHGLDTPAGDGDEEEDEVNGRISLVQALLESRIPDLPPIGTRRPQQPILLSHPIATGDDEPSCSQTSETNVHSGDAAPSAHRSGGRRRRWSVILGQSQVSASETSSTVTTPAAREHAFTPSRSQSIRSAASAGYPPPSDVPSLVTPSSAEVPPLPEASSSVISSQSSRSRFIPRIISNAFHPRRSDGHSHVPVLTNTETDSWKKGNGNHPAHHAPPPKLEYVKLPGTKGALMIKAVETAKKSFLAILCGENGEKVELFAGTYRTALGLSRTFILPDSPRSLELQLQGDDLVEVFLVFSQNVFGLEPATVRVREVRIGRAERRAARRRAREIRTGEAASHDADSPSLVEEDMNVNVSIGVTVAVGSTIVASGDGPDGPQSPLIPNHHPDEHTDRPTTPNEPTNASAIAHAEELVALATAQMGPYTTFQQLSFAPKFPLASIADEYIIPPTYPDFIDYRTEYEPEVSGGGITDLAQIQFSPPGLPVPAPSAPSKWYYRDPRNIVHGPWKASLMQAWYKDGLLPLDLPVRKEEDVEYMLLKDLRLQSVDPSHPFRSPPPPPLPNPDSSTITQNNAKPLLRPISLLAQPRHFGPPALFFSSRGGHSTAIVDARGRSVLKGRFMWSVDDHDENSNSALTSRMGDVKRIEAFDVEDRSVLVAMRQGGLEVVDLGDALLKPADESRATLPQFAPPPSNTSRRGPFVWRIGTPVSSSPNSSTVLSNKSKGGHGHISGKKQSTGYTRSTAGKTEFSLGDVDLDIQNEVLFLGRKDDEVYICERNAGFFRILRLCLSAS